MSSWYPLLSLTLTVFTLLVFLRAALHKVFDFLEFQGFVADYELVPQFLVWPVSALLVGVEFLIVVLLLVNPTRGWGLLLAACVLALYGVAMAINLVRGRTQIECGCGGAPQHLGKTLLWRNFTLIVLTLLPLAQLPHALSLVEAAVSIAAGVFLWLLYGLFEQANANLMALNAERSA